MGPSPQFHFLCNGYGRKSLMEVEIYLKVI